MPIIKAIVATAVLAASAQAAEPSAADRAAITAVIAVEDAAWGRGDAAGFSAAALPEIVFTNIVGLFAVGRAGFEAQHARIFAGIYKGSTLHQTVEHIAMVRPDVAIVDTLTAVSGFVRLSPGVVADNGVLHTRLEQVMVRDGGRWTIAAYHNVVVNAAALASMPPLK